MNDGETTTASVEAIGRCYVGTVPSIERGEWDRAQVYYVDRVEDGEKLYGYALPHRVLHSPTGFSWGFNGSGPADLARSILADHLGYVPHQHLYQAFKRDHIAPLSGDTWVLLVAAVDAWLDRHKSDPDRSVCGVCRLLVSDTAGDGESFCACLTIEPPDQAIIDSIDINRVIVPSSYDEPAAIEVAAPSEPGMVGHVDVDQLGLTFSADTTLETAAELTRRLVTQQARLPWLIGDAFNQGEAMFGEAWFAAFDGLDYELHTLTDFAWVATRIPRDRRRIDLSWSHHREVAALDPEDRDKYLEQAVSERWTRAELRAALKGPSLAPPSKPAPVVDQLSGGAGDDAGGQTDSAPDGSGDGLEPIPFPSGVSRQDGENVARDGAQSADGDDVRAGAPVSIGDPGRVPSSIDPEDLAAPIVRGAFKRYASTAGIQTLNGPEWAAFRAGWCGGYDQHVIDSAKAAPAVKTVKPVKPAKAAASKIRPVPKPAAKKGPRGAQ